MGPDAEKPETAKPDTEKSKVNTGELIVKEIKAGALILKAFGSRTVVLQILSILALLAIVVVAYYSWRYGLMAIVGWANKSQWRWTFAWIGVVFAAFAPMYVAMGAWAIIAPALRAAAESKEREVLGELDRLENQIRGSTEPVDYAIYGRKALNAYYLMGQNQARLSFYIGVAAMIFGFVFLLAGLLVQVVDVSKVSFLRDDPSVEIVAVGGGLIIEFVAATFLWIYRAAIVQLTVYYKRQMLVHSSLIAVAVSNKMDDQRQAALMKIIDTMITPYWEDTTAKLPAPRVKKSPKADT